MKEILINIFTSYYTWIAIEVIVIAILVFFVIKNSRKKKATLRDIEKRNIAFQYKELDEMLANRKRNEK